MVKKCKEFRSIDIAVFHVGKWRTSIYPKFSLSAPAALPIISDKRELTVSIFLICDVEYKEGSYCQKLYFGLNGHFCSKFNTLLRTYSMDLHPERRIWQFYFTLPDFLLIGRNTGSCKINALKVDRPTSIALFWSISNAGKSPSINLSSLRPAVSCTKA